MSDENLMPMIERYKRELMEFKKQQPPQPYQQEEPSGAGVNGPAENGDSREARLVEAAEEAQRRLEENEAQARREIEAAEEIARSHEQRMQEARRVAQREAQGAEFLPEGANLRTPDSTRITPSTDMMSEEPPIRGRQPTVPTRSAARTRGGAFGNSRRLSYSFEAAQGANRRRAERPESMAETGEGTFSVRQGDEEGQSRAVTVMAEDLPDKNSRDVQTYSFGEDVVPTYAEQAVPVVLDNVADLPENDFPPAVNGTETVERAPQANPNAAINGNFVSDQVFPPSADNNENIYSSYNNATVVYDSYEDLLSSNPATGMLRVQVFAAEETIPIANAKVIVSVPIGENEYTFYSELTDSNGVIYGLLLPAPDKSLSAYPTALRPYAQYNVMVEHPSFVVAYFRGVLIFDGIETVQPVQLVPKTEGQNINEEMIYNENAINGVGQGSE